MSNIKCQIQNHHEKRITSVCLNKDCEGKRLCCFVCIGQIHASHQDQTIEVEQINDFIQKESTEEVKFPQSYSYGQLQIIQGLEQMSNLTDSLQKVIKAKIELAKQQNLKEFLKQSSNIQQGIQYWNILIEGILNYVQVDNYLIIPKQQNEGQLSETERKQIQIIRKSEQNIKEIISSLNILSQAKKQLQFSKKPIELAGHSDEVNQVTISQDGLLIASGSSDKTVKLWDVKSQTILQTIQNDCQVYRVAISPKNEYLAFQDNNNSVKLFDLKLKKVLWTQKEHKKVIECIVFSQDTQFLLSGGYDEKLIIWSVINNTKVHSFETDSSIQSTVISRDNKLVSCICLEGGTIYIWDFLTKTKLVQEEKTHSDGFGLCTSADSQIYISSGRNGEIKIWKLNESQKQQQIFTLTQSIQAANKYIYKVLSTPDDLYIISICQEGQIMIYERETGKLIQVLESRTKSSQKYQFQWFSFYAYISISNDMNTLVSSNGKDKTFRIWTRE